jgi:hypothetical protein
MKDDGTGCSGWWDQHTAMDSFASSASSKFQPVTAKRLMFNALNRWFLRWSP